MIVPFPWSCKGWERNSYQAADWLKRGRARVAFRSRASYCVRVDDLAIILETPPVWATIRLRRSAPVLNARHMENGNVSWMVWRIPENTYAAENVGYVFDYDELARLAVADFGKNPSGTWQNDTKYDVGSAASPITYDGDGNIAALDRNDELGNGSAINYSYYANSNRLTSVAGGYASSYTYDANGAVTSDSGRGITSVDYDARSLPTSVVVGGSTYTCRYDASGQRVYKTRSGGGDTAYYVRGPGGETLAVYDGCGSVLYWNVLAGSEVIGKALPDAQPPSCSQ